MKFILPGGSGQVGTVLCSALRARGHDVTVLTRRPDQRRAGDSIWWDGETLGRWTQALDGADAVINLCGRSVDCRYTTRNRRAMMDSRVGPTRLIAQALQAAVRPPGVWLQASTATIYAHRYDAPNDEETGRLGGGEPDAPDTWRFSIEVATQWERAAREVALPRTRIVLMRSAMIMSPTPQGVFDVLLRLVRLGLGGTSGDGRQFVSWIHQADFSEAVLWLVTHPEFEGPVNLCSPRPLPNQDFMAALRQAWGSRTGLPSPRWLLELGAVFLRTETELILKSRRVVPGRLLASGFQFQFPEWPPAAKDLCQRWREERRDRRLSA